MTIDTLLRDSDEQLRLAIEAAGMGLWDLDIATEQLYWPTRVKAMFAISADVPVSMADYYPGLYEENRARTMPPLRPPSILASGLFTTSSIRTVGKEDGLLRWSGCQRQSDL